MCSKGSGNSNNNSNNKEPAAGLKKYKKNKESKEAKTCRKFFDNQQEKTFAENAYISVFNAREGESGKLWETVNILPFILRSQ